MLMNIKQNRTMITIIISKMYKTECKVMIKTNNGHGTNVTADYEN